MKSFLKSNAATISLLRFIANWLTRNQPKVLMYHRFSENEIDRYISRTLFEKQIEFLKYNKYNVITLSELSEVLKNKNRLKKHTVVLTFDDGYHDFFDIAYQVLNKYEMEGTLFITTNFVSKKCWMYQDKVSYVFETTKLMPKELSLPSKKIYTSIEIKKMGLNNIWHQICEELIPFSEAERSVYLEYLAGIFDINIPTIAPKKYSAISWSQIGEVINNRIEVGSHCVHHLSLANQPNDVVKDELTTSKNAIEMRLDKDVKSFCFPFGMKSDTNKKVESMVEEAGYQCACVAHNESKDRSLFNIGRIGIENDYESFINKVTGLTRN